MKVDGHFGPLTAHWIKYFQIDCRKRGLSVHVDGRVDRAKGEQWSHSSITQTGYTIGHMNLTYRRRYPLEHDHLETHPAVPAPLAAELHEMT